MEASEGRDGPAKKSPPFPIVRARAWPGIVPIDQIRFFSSCMFSPSPRISLVKTSKLAGVPASRVFSPLTIDS